MKLYMLAVSLALVISVSAQIPATDTDYVKEPTSANAIALIVFGLIALLLLIPPFYVQYQGRNIGQCCQIVYVCLANLFTVLNAIIWPNFSYEEWWDGVGLCDVEAKIQYPIFTGVACATVAIMRRLAMAIDPNKLTITTSKRDRLRATIEDLAICLFVPFLQACLHYIIQFNRYYIQAVVGCTASYDNSWPTIVINFMWPPIFSIIVCYYAILICIRLRQHRTKVSQLLGNNSKNLSMFIRLTCNSFLIVLIYTPVSFYLFYVNLDIVWFSYSWDIVHDPATWWTIIYLPDIRSRTSTKWTNVVMAFLIFFFFGMGQHAMEVYRQTALKAGLGRFSPAFYQRRGSENGGPSTWGSRFSLVSKLRHYFERERKTSNATFESVATNAGTFRSRKSTILPTYAHISPQTVLFPSSLRKLSSAYQPSSSSNERDRTSSLDSRTNTNHVLEGNWSPHLLPSLHNTRARNNGLTPGGYFMPSFSGVNIPNPIAKWMSSKKQANTDRAAPGDAKPSTAFSSPSAAGSANSRTAGSELQDFVLESGGAGGSGSKSGIRTTVWSDKDAKRAESDAGLGEGVKVKTKIETRQEGFDVDDTGAF